MRKTGGTLGATDTDWVERDNAAGELRGPFRLRPSGFSEEIGMSLNRGGMMAGGVMGGI